MANIKNLAIGTVGTAPSPDTSGTSLVLTTGHGARFPSAPFYATVFPTGALPSVSNSEIVLVTAISTDTLTITRAQKSTTAKAIAAGWIISNAIYTEDLFTSSITTNEVPSGTINGSNTVFTTAAAFTNIWVYKNGVRMKGGGADYTVTNNTTITFVTAPATGTVLLVDYIVGSTAMINGSNSMIADETPSGTVNGSTTAFTTAFPYVPGSLKVFINGLKQKTTTHFTETTPTTGVFTMSEAPLTGDIITVEYQFVASVTGNADTVDGYHASQTAAASTIPVLDSNGKLPVGVLSASSYTATVATSQTTTSTSYTDLSTAGPAVTVTTGSYALVIIGGRLSDGSAGQWAYMGFAVSGATTTAAADATALGFGQSATTVDSFVQASQVFLVALTPGSNVFTAKYRVTGGTGTFINRNITVIPL